MPDKGKGPKPEGEKETKEKAPYFYYDIAEESSQELEEVIVKDDQDEPLRKLGKAIMYEW